MRDDSDGMAFLKLKIFSRRALGNSINTFLIVTFCSLSLDLFCPSELSAGGIFSKKRRDSSANRSQEDDSSHSQESIARERRRNREIVRRRLERAREARRARRQQENVAQQRAAEVGPRREQRSAVTCDSRMCCQKRDKKPVPVAQDESVNERQESNKSRRIAWADFQCGDPAGDYPGFQFQEGQTHLLQDGEGWWYRAVIQKLRPSKRGRYLKAKFHYSGWSERYDEWVALSPKNLAARGGRLRLWDESKEATCAICLQDQVASAMRVLSGCGHHLCFGCHEHIVSDSSIPNRCHLCRQPYSRDDLDS